MERLCAEVSEIMKNTNWFNSCLLPVSCSVPISSPSMMRLPVVRRVVRVTPLPPYKHSEGSEAKQQGTPTPEQGGQQSINGEV